MKIVQLSGVGDLTPIKIFLELEKVSIKVIENLSDLECISIIIDLSRNYVTTAWK